MNSFNYLCKKYNKDIFKWLIVPLGIISVLSVLYLLIFFWSDYFWGVFPFFIAVLIISAYICGYIYILDDEYFISRISVFLLLVLITGGCLYLSGLFVYLGIFAWERNPELPSFHIFPCVEYLIDLIFNVSTRGFYV
jgi:hypothetical protein